MQRVMLLILATGLFSLAGGQQGALTSNDFARFNTGLGDPTVIKATGNALADHGMKELAIDRETRIAQNQFFSHKIEVTGITNQKSSGRCWLFAGLNILRPRMIEEFDLAEFEFSQNFLFFYDKMEKANLFLNQVIDWRSRNPNDRELTWLLQHPIGDGGQWNMVVDLVEKYGLVPMYAMPETYASSHTGDLNDVLSKRLRKAAAGIMNGNKTGMSIEDAHQIREAALQDIYRVLVLTLGEPPQSFTWQYEDKDGDISKPKTYTPVEFARQAVEANLDEYVYLLTNPLQEYFQTYEISLDRDLFEKPDMFVLNVPMADLKQATLQSVLNDQPVWFGCDVGQQHLGDDGAMVMGIYDFEALLGVDISLTRSEQLLFRESIPTHAMVFVGVDVVNGKPRQWLVENSWGTERGRDGYWTMTDAWFDQYLYGSIVHEKFITREMKTALTGQPVTLPPWDPMYLMIKGK
ncbi:MAG: C1 family peptidase [Lentisphaeria bacterium]|nr:C1 family peptidase [Candidatus Neomarinimicrobiota bacterium]MCF7841969.1 C1 family peptidase [Lentisphaeria bacterium]